MFRTVARQAAQLGQLAKQTTPSSSGKFDKLTNPYLRRMAALHPPKKVWPPDFKYLSHEEQLRFEKKWKRRSKLATARPRWIKFTKLAQQFLITFFLIYAVMFLDWGSQPHPFDPIRTKFWNALGQEYVPAPKWQVVRPSDRPEGRS